MSSLSLSSGLGDHSSLEIKMLYYPFSLHKTFKSIINNSFEKWPPNRIWNKFSTTMVTLENLENWNRKKKWKLEFIKKIDSGNVKWTGKKPIWDDLKVLIQRNTFTTDEPCQYWKMMWSALQTCPHCRTFPVSSISHLTVWNLRTWLS